MYQLLDDFFEESLQADVMSLRQETISKYQEMYNNKSFKNRHLFMLFKEYQDLVLKSAQSGKFAGKDQVDLMEVLVKETSAIYKKYQLFYISIKWRLIIRINNKS